MGLSPTVFNVVKSGATALVKWETVYEENSDYFIIERSDNARTWNAIGRVEAAGSSSSVLSYSYRDFHPLQGNNYYRLRMVDKDGGSKLSRTHWPVEVKSGSSVINISNQKGSRSIDLKL